MLIYGNIGVLVLRAVIGLLFAGHGAQKLFGWFGGTGLKGHTVMMEKLEMHPPLVWAWISALAEFLGGLGLAFGLLTPLAAVGLIGSMLVAIVRVHWQYGFWNSKGGIEFPVALLTAAFVVGLMGPGVYSLDYVLAIALPTPATFLVALVLMLMAVGLLLIRRTNVSPHSSQRQTA